MPFTHTMTANLKKTTISDYANSLKKRGVKIFSGNNKVFWAKHESGTMVRVPNFHSMPPSSQEVQRVLWRGRAAVASYLLEPDEQHPANAWLYLCTDQTYSLDKLAKRARRDIRRGLRELTIAPLTSEQLLAHGFPAFHDTRRRNGLNDGTPEEFHRWFTDLAKLPEIVYLGAWRGEELAAFANITEVEDWAECGCFSMDVFLRYCPNDVLIYSILSCYLVERKYRLVSYGLSSIQDESNTAGLHAFKVKLGFEAHPIHRAFVPHPLLIPFINPLTLWSVSVILRLKPRDRRLRKAQGVLACMLTTPHAAQKLMKNIEER